MTQRRSGTTISTCQDESGGRGAVGGTVSGIVSGVVSSEVKWAYHVLGVEERRNAEFFFSDRKGQPIVLQNIFLLQRRKPARCQAKKKLLTSNRSMTR